MNHANMENNTSKSFGYWKIIDVDNKSCALEMHLRKNHNISIDEYLKLYYNN